MESKRLECKINTKKKSYTLKSWKDSFEGRRNSFICSNCNQYMLPKLMEDDTIGLFSQNSKKYVEAKWEEEKLGMGWKNVLYHIFSVRRIILNTGCIASFKFHGLFCHY